MPVIAPAAARDLWLGSSSYAGQLQNLLLPFPSAEIEAFEVSALMNSAKNDSPGVRVANRWLSATALNATGASTAVAR